MIPDVPEQVRKTVVAAGNESWLDELPGVVDSLARVLAFATAMSPDLAAVGKNAACFAFCAARDRNA